MLLSQLAFLHHWFLLRDVYSIRQIPDYSAKKTREPDRFTKIPDASRFWYSLDGYAQERTCGKQDVCENLFTATNIRPEAKEQPRIVHFELV
jgi:hypothetical protein